MNSKDPTKPLKLTRRIASDQNALTRLDVPYSGVADSAECFNILGMHAESLARFAKTDMGLYSTHDWVHGFPTGFTVCGPLMTWHFVSFVSVSKLAAAPQFPVLRQKRPRRK